MVRTAGSQRLPLHGASPRRRCVSANLEEPCAGAPRALGLPRLPGPGRHDASPGRTRLVTACRRSSPGGFITPRAEVAGCPDAAPDPPGRSQADEPIKRVRSHEDRPRTQCKEDLKVNKGLLSLAGV